MAIYSDILRAGLCCECFSACPYVRLLVWSLRLFVARTTSTRCITSLFCSTSNAARVAMLHLEVRLARCSYASIPLFKTCARFKRGKMVTRVFQLLRINDDCLPLQNDAIVRGHAIASALCTTQCETHALQTTSLSP